MNMHVMMNHMVLLNYGDFVLKKPLVNRKRPAEPQAEVKNNFFREKYIFQKKKFF